MHAKHPAMYKATPHDEGSSCRNVITDQRGILRNFEHRLKKRNIIWHLTGSDWGLYHFPRYVENKTCTSYTPRWSAGHIAGVTREGMAMETEFFTYPSQTQAEIEASWPRTRVEIGTMIFTLPRMCCVNKLKLYGNYFWTSSSFSERLSLFLEGKNKIVLFWIETEIERHFFFALGKDFKWTTFQKECVIKKTVEVEPGSRGVKMMI